MPSPSYCITFLLSWTLTTVAMAAEPSLEIKSLGTTRVQGKVIPIGPAVDIRGEIGTTEQMPPVQVQLAWRKLEADSWWLSKHHAAPEMKRHTNVWTALGLRIGDAFDSGHHFEIVALLTPVQQPLPPGAIDPQRLRTMALAVSPAIVVERSAAGEDERLVPVRIRIDTMADLPIGPDVINEARMKESIGGEVLGARPDNHLRVVVQPLENEGRWVMDYDPEINGRRWEGRALFGNAREGAWDEYSLYAVVSRKALPPGRILPREWARITRELILAVSPAIRVRRIEPPIGDGIRLVIQAVDDRSIEPSFTQELEVSKRSNVQGQLYGRWPSRDEILWVLSSPRNQSVPWRVVGRASRISDQYWEMPPQYFGKPGDRLSLVVVLARGDLRNLAPEAIHENMAFSRRVDVTVKDEPILNVAVESVGRRSVETSAEGGFVAESAISSDVTGHISGRILVPGEEVWVLRSLSGRWQLLGRAVMQNRNQWSLAPRLLGSPGERITVLAVVATDPKPLEEGDLSQVAAYSPQVQVSLKEQR